MLFNQTLPCPLCTRVRIVVSLFVVLCLGLEGLVAGVPVTVTPVTARHGMVVAGHPEATAAGVAVLKAGGNAIDAAVATSLALGVAEPYGSGLGGKIMLMFFEAKSGRVYVVDGMDQAGSLDVTTYLQRPEEDRTYGYGSVCVPGLAAGLWAAHQRWGAARWVDDVRPALQHPVDALRLDAVLAEELGGPPGRDDLEAERDQALDRGDHARLVGLLYRHEDDAAQRHL